MYVIVCLAILSMIAPVRNPRLLIVLCGGLFLLGLVLLICGITGIGSLLMVWAVLMFCVQVARYGK